MKKLFLIIFALAMTLAVFADVYTIGTGTSTQSYIPFYGLYDYSWSKVIYTAAEMTTAGVPANTAITGISFYVGNTPENYIAEDQRVYVRHTADTVINTDYVANPLTDFTEVWVGDLTWNGGGWHNILFTNTFTWNGTDNLEILWYNWDGAYQSGPNFRYTTTTANLACYKYGDGAMPITVGTATTSRPNIRILDATVSIPGAVSALLTPANAAINVAQPTQFSWSAPTTGGVPTGYKLYIKANDNNFTGVSPIAVTGTSHSTMLNYSTEYYWKVVATNSAGDSPDSAVWSFTTRDDPTKPIPYIQDFNSGTSLAAIDWTGNMSITSNHGTNGSNGLYRNLWSSATSANAETPIVGPMATNSQLMFDYRYVNYTGYPNTPLTLVAGDKLEIQVAPAGGTFTTIHTIDQNNHVTSTDFANVIVPINGYAGQTIQVKFLATWGAGDYYLDIDNVTLRETPAGGVLVVSPSPVAMGTGYVGFSKTQQVALTNTGVAALTVNSIALASTVNFQLQDLPTLPVTINPGDPAVPFTVVFTPTTAGELSTQLLIGDTRANSSINVTGTGVQPLEGEICENPYIVTLPLVDYDGTTEGYANDYTSAMFTGLTSASYVSGKDWVAKITVPTLGNLNITLANQTGAPAYQYMGMFLVNTIPSLDTPAAVLAQAYGTAPFSIANYNATPGDYYLIIDNWPTPDNIYFTLNISFVEATDPPGPATLVAPADEAIGVSATPTLSWTSGGGVVEKYYVSYGTVSPFTTVLNNHDNGTATTYAITSPLNYETEYWWKVSPWNSVAGYAENQATWTFTTLANPTISSFPFFEGFESGYTNGASVLGNWSQLVGPEYETQYWTASNNQTTYNRPPRTGNWNATLRYNGESTLVRPIQLEAGTDYQIEFYARQDTDTSTAAKIQAKLGNAPTLAALTTEITPQTGLVSGDYQKVSGTFSVDVDGIYYIGIHGWLNITPWYISMDDIAIREMISGPPATPTLTYPNDVATDMSVYGFNLTWEPDLDNGGLPTYYAVFMSQDEETIYDDHYFEVDDPFFNPVTDSEGAIVFAYEDRWFWTVVAGNLDGESDPATVRSFQIEADPAITSFPWCEGFEGNTFPPAGWTMVDDDGDGENWYQFSVDPHTGNYSATSASYINYVGELYPDNWLITPPLAIPATGDYMVEYYVASQDPDWPEEHYGFYVSTSGPAIANFTMLSQETLEDGDWHQRSNPLASYAGQTVHFAFRHFNSTDNYMMKIDDVCVREIPQAPMLSITPTEFDFGTTHTFTPTTPKTFTLSNIGIGTIDVGVGDIWLTDDIEGNFVLDTQDLPVEISGTEPYNFTVQFIAQSAGFKSATLNIQDNITRAIHTVALTGEAVEEPIASVIMLEGELYGADAAYIDWASIYGDPTQTGYLHWDDSLDRGAVGAGANQYHAAVMFGSEVMEHTVGQVLDGVMIHLNEEPQTVDYLKVWSGTDADIAPETLLATEAVSGLTVGWNYIPLTTPVPTTGIEALWVGYHVNGIAGTFPGSTDGLYGVDGRGNLVELDDEWFTLEDAGIEGNWLIHAHFTDEAKYLTSRRTPTLTPKTTHAQVKNQKDMRDLPLAAIQTVEMNRVLRGFNIFRDNVQINTTTVAAYYYTDENLAPGTYYYSVQSVHDSTNGPISYEVPVTIPEPPAPFALPFTEDWSAGMEENWWTAGGTNWNIDSSTGNPAPSARFYWSPRVYDYNIPLTSYSFDATGLNTVTLKFDLFLSNYSPTIENNMAWEVWDGSVWNRIDERSSLNGSFGWTTLSYNISEYAANGVFKIRFVAEGVDSYQINYWYIDNISLYSLPESLDPVTDLSVSKSGSDFILDWTAVEGAQWYAIYTSDDPYTGFTFAYLVESAGDLTIPASMLGSDKLFVRITAGAGDTPPLPAKRN